MYIGPWQEYRLAQLQDDAVQRLRREWEAQLRAELPEGDESRVRELLQPLAAKLPALLLSATTGKTARRLHGAGASVKPRRPATAASSGRSEQAEDIDRAQQGHRKAGKSGNQETHDAGAGAAATAEVGKKPQVPKAPTRKKAKKPSSAPLTAIEQVQRRKKMFATWIKRAGSGPDGGDEPAETADSDMSPSPQGDEQMTADMGSQSVRLPPLPSSQAVVSIATARSHPADRVSHTQLPPLSSASNGWDVVYDSIASGALASSAQLAPTEEPGLEDSFDEEEVNNFLNWTDTLLCPADLDDCGNLE